MISGGRLICLCNQQFGSLAQLLTHSMEVHGVVLKCPSASRTKKVRCNPILPVSEIKLEPNICYICHRPIPVGKETQEAHGNLIHREISECVK